MSLTYRFTPTASPPAPGSSGTELNLRRTRKSSLAASITHNASIQTYYTIRCLADQALIDSAYRAYAYFRWVDNTIDQENLEKSERLAFLARQQEIIKRCYRGERPPNLHPAEQLAADLIHSDHSPNSGLQTYIQHMMAVMTFDAQRRGRLISEAELKEYTHSLAVAVTEALHHFIGPNCFSPHDQTRYLAVTGAHTTHLLRDTIEDTAAGYYNIPREYLTVHHITPTDITHQAYQTWVQNRVALARNCFAAGRAYLARVQNFRCRLAGYAYIGRFEIILNAIERDHYHLRPAYPERQSKKHIPRLILTALSQTIGK